MSDDQQDNNNKPNERKSSQEQYEMLKRCSDAEDMTEWNDWRERCPDEVVWLQSRNFKGWFLQGANFMHGRRANKATDTLIEFSEVHFEESVFEWADLQKALFGGARMKGTKFWSANAEGADFNKTCLTKAKLQIANFKKCDFNNANLQEANLSGANLQGAKLMLAKLQKAVFRTTIVDGETLIWRCRIDRDTNFSGVGLDAIRIHPGTKQLLEYNNRRRNWEGWYEGKSNNIWKQGLCKFLTFPVRLFWWMSDYGRSILRIVIWFFVWALLFALVYWKWPAFIAFNGKAEIDNFQNFWHALYFSVVTMTTLGFGDIAANPYSWGGQTLLMIQVLLGYVMLGALVTRFAVLFTAGGPAGKFSDE